MTIDPVDSTLGRTEHGWPLLGPNSYVDAVPAYTADLAAKLENADADVAAAINAAADAQAAAAQVLPAYGRAAKIDGFQATGGSVAVQLQADFSTGGVTYDAANGGGLKVPTAGVYLASFTGFFSGAKTGFCSIRLQRWRAGANVTIATAMMHKPDGNDYAIARAEMVQLEAGDVLTLRATASSNLWGDAAKTGCTLSVVRL